MYTSEFSILLFGRGEDPVEPQVRLQARFAPTPTDDGSGLSPFPIDRRVSVPESSTPQPFSIDDEGLNADPREVAVSVWSASRPGDGPFFRSGTLRDLPAPSPQNPQGRIGILGPGPVVRTIAELDGTVQARMAATGPRTVAAGTTLTGLTISPNPIDPGKLFFVAMGTYDGPLPPPPSITITDPITGATITTPPPPAPPGPFGVRYTGALNLLPQADAFDTSLIIQASISEPDLSIFAISTGNPLADGPAWVIAKLLDLVGPAIEAGIRGDVEAALSEEVSAAIREEVLTTVGGQNATLSPNAVISLQSVEITVTDVTFLASLGAFGNVIVREAGTGCFPVLLLATLAGTAAVGTWLA